MTFILMVYRMVCKIKIHRQINPATIPYILSMNGFIVNYKQNKHYVVFVDILWGVR